MNVYMDTEEKIVKVDCLNIASHSVENFSSCCITLPIDYYSKCNFVPLPFSRGN